MIHIDIGGARMPALGFGTWRLAGEGGVAAIRTALDAGYRHIDTASRYGNEREVGQALRASGLPRDALFVTTKVWFDALDAEGVRRSTAESLDRLGLDHVDLLLVHWPSPIVPLAETLAAFEAERTAGRARHVGVSNFTRRHLAEAAALGIGPLVCDQVEFHPFLDQRPLLAALRDRGMALTAYQPIARGDVFRDPAIAAIATRHGRNPAQVALRWLLQQGAAAIPRSENPGHIRANFAVFDFALTDAEMSAISALGRPDGRRVNPDFAPDWNAA